MSKKYVREAKFRAAAAMAEHLNKNTFNEAIPFVDYLNRAGATLHTRYENQCSYEWACTEEYERVTDKRQKTLLKNASEFGFIVTDDVNEKREGAFIRMQTDPRGWPIELIFNTAESRNSYSLGGK